jgi:hypothetical protein
MTKNIPILERTIECPCCRTNTMRKSLGIVVGQEFFCDRCHQYFGVGELVNQFNYDLGDMELAFDTVSNINEPVWFNIKDREENYEVVNHILSGFEEWQVGDYFEGCSNEGIDTGAIHV